MRRDLEQKLLTWKGLRQPVPLIIRGARQVGKTYLVESFGRREFEELITINFEERGEFARCFDEDLDPHRILRALEALANRKIDPMRTLLFFDEIQRAPRAIMALRYFKEKVADLHIIAAGSLLEFVLDEENFSFPVGRVEFLRLLPLSFAEFLDATGQSILRGRIDDLSSPLEEVLHQRLLKAIRDYFYVGGMPAVVSSYIESGSLMEAQRKQSSLLQTYENDFAKYASVAMHRNLRILYEQAPYLVGKYFRYSKVDPTISSRDLTEALESLCRAGLIYQIFHTYASGLPLRAQINRKKFKLLMSDVGLMQAAMQSPPDPTTLNLLGMHEGAVAEQFVGQELLVSSDPYLDARLHFWDREKAGSSAEVDYVINARGNIVPIEVKAGATGRLRSLKQFMIDKKVSLGVRISERPLAFEGGVLSIPFYLTHRLPDLVAEANSRFGGAST